METLDKNKYKIAIAYLLQLVSSKRLNIAFDCGQIPEKVSEIIKLIKERDKLDIENLSKEDYVTYELILTDILSEILSSPVEENLEDELFLINKSINISNSIPTAKVSIDDSLGRRLKNLGITLSGIESYYLTPDYISMIKLRDKEFLFETKAVTVHGQKKFLFSLVQIERYYSEIKKYIIADSYLLNFEKSGVLYRSPVRAFLFLLKTYGSLMEFNGIKKKFFINIEESNIPDAIIFKVVSHGKGRVLKVQGNPIFNGFNQIGIWIPFAYLFDEESYLKDFRERKI